MTIDTQTPPASLSAAVPPGFAASYAATLPPGSSDEMIEPDGSLAPHWSLLVTQLDELGSPELRRRWEQGRRIIRENGITHNIYGDPSGIERPWNLDLVPLLIPAATWRQVSAGLTQRARLLDALLADLYGPATSVAQGWLPPELLYANPGFLRACHGVTPPRGRWLHLYSADLIRLANGEFCVLNDRTQAPSGAGYSLENRIVLSGILPTAFRQCHVHRLAPFFIALRKTLTSLAPAHRENPRIVLLTPGPYNETYFEHAYLAKYLGYTLAQGNDLTVRDGVVYLKTLSGLNRVDVILRRVDDDFCDPLELYQNSFLGVTGLVEAVRQGNVAVANALGSGIAQAPALLCFLPDLCRHLLHEELLLPSVQTWWCGQPDSLKYVLENLPRLVIKPAYPTAGSPPLFGAELSQDHLKILAGQISAHPHKFVGQERLVPRTAPVLTENHPEVRRVVIRAYATADNDSYTVMAGGLTRVTGSRDSLVVSLQKGGGSKDTWILAEGPVNEASLLTTVGQPVELTRAGGELTSRVADDLFWLGRYVQRFESEVRLARCLFQRLADQGRADGALTINVLASSLFGAAATRIEERPTATLVAQTFNGPGSAGLKSDITLVRNLVRGLRDRVSTDAWRILQGIERHLTEFNTRVEDDRIGEVVELLNRLIVDLMAFGGIVAESMTRGQGWRFLDMGTRIERSIAIARLLRSTLGRDIPAESATLEALLEIADSSLTYRRRYLTQLQTHAVVDLLVADDTNPRAVLFQICALEEHLAHLPRDLSHPHRSPDRQAAMKLRTQLNMADLRSACQPNKRGDRDGLISLMTNVVDSLGKISEWVSRIYFSHAAVSRSLNQGGPERIR